MHSYYSDGNLSPADLLQKCKERGLEIISLADHENIGGVIEAKEVGKTLGIIVIPGMEFAAEFQGTEHHILSYFYDCNNQKLKEFLDTWRESKVIQIKAIIENLHRFGFNISLDEVKARARGSFDRFHIAWATFPNSEKSAEEMEKRKAFFHKFLLEKSSGGEGLAFVERQKPDIRSVINIIHNSGGMAFLAHPFWRIKEAPIIRELSSTFRKIGLDGIETLYPHHNQEQTLTLHNIAQELSMHESCGSDFHRDDGSVRQIGNFQTFGTEINLSWITQEVTRETYLS